jgi:hypothetical protein
MSLRLIVVTLAAGFFAVLIGVLLVSDGRSVEPDAVVSVNSTTSSPNSQTNVELSISPSAGKTIGALRVVMSYDDALLLATDCSAPSGSGIGLCNAALSSGEIGFAFSNLFGLNGSLGTVTFSTLAIPGTANLAIAVTTCADEQGIDLNCSAESGVVTIAETTPSPTPPPTPPPTAAPTLPPNPPPPPFEVGSIICFEVLETDAECDGDSSPNASTDMRAKYCLGWASACSSQPLVSEVDDSMYSLVIFFAPPGWVTALGSNVTRGAVTGRVESQQTLGMFNNACDSTIGVADTLLSSSTTTTETIASKPVGQADPMEPFALDVNPPNGLPDGVDKYPAFLNQLVSGGQPRARHSAVTRVLGRWRTLNFLIFEPGTHLIVGGRNLPLRSELGYPTVAVVQDPTSPDSPSAVSDACAPEVANYIALGKTLNNPCTPTPVDGGNCPGGDPPRERAGYPMLPCELGNELDEDGDGTVNDGCADGPPQVGPVSEGSRIPGSCVGSDEGGCSSLGNPASIGGHTWTIALQSQRDADGDGIDNPLDVCSLVSNASWNPRVFGSPSDPDSDGLPNDCDPNPAAAGGQSPLTCPSGITGPDQDQDCFANRQDNCPNANQLADPGSPPHPVSNLPTAVDVDADGIGDGCDPNVTAADGKRAGVCLRHSLVVGGPTGPILGSKDVVPGLECLTPPDLDGDGWDGLLEQGSPLCGNGVNDDSVAQGGSDDAVIDDGCGVPLVGAHSEAEFRVGTSLEDPCGYAGWPADLFTLGMSLNKLDVQDILSFLAPVRRYETDPGNPFFNSRWDLVPARGSPPVGPHWINIQDILALIGGPSWNPPMFSGARAFGRHCASPP